MLRTERTEAEQQDTGMPELYNPLRVRASSLDEFPISFSRVPIHRIKSIHIIRMDFKSSKSMLTL